MFGSILKVFILLIILHSPVSRQGDVIGKDFGYSQLEQKEWGMDFKRCDGESQSPIEIISEEAIPINIQPLNLFAYDWALPTPLILKNNGKTTFVTIKPKPTSEYFIPQVSGGNLNGIYIFDSFHFHWGDTNAKGSEHWIDENQYALELHIVHKNIKYKPKDAWKYPDGMVVFAILFETSPRDNPTLEPIVSNLHLICEYNASTYIWTPCSLDSLMRNINIGRYYTYQGSLTTPPCSESVTWIVFSDVTKVSYSQVERFRHLTTRNGCTIAKNYRLLQPLNGRKVYVRKNFSCRRHV